MCDVQIEIYPDLEKSLLDLLHNSGYPGIKFEKKVDFENFIIKDLIKKIFFKLFFKYSLCFLSSSKLGFKSFL